MDSVSEDSRLISTDNITQEWDLTGLFPQPQPVHLELGSGDGSFLLQHAEKHPELNHIGVERLLGRLRKIDRKATRRQLRNIRLIRLEASYVMAYLIPESTISSLHVYFPDPWPKRKHHRRRLIQDTFALTASRILVPNATIHLRTDNEDYFKQMTEVFDRNPHYEPCETELGLLEIQTDFERFFREQGCEVHVQSYVYKDPGLQEDTSILHRP